MATSQYLPFATGVGANALPYNLYTAAPYAALIQSGNVPGIALSEFINTTLRQATVGVAGVAKLATDYGAFDCLDDGSPDNFALALKSALDAIIASAQFWRPGDLKPSLVNAVPTGWLRANGAIVLRATYPALFAVIGTQYNTGVAGDSFQLPDLRGEFLRGWDNGRGVDASRVLGSSQAELVGDHTHLMNQQDRRIGDADGAVGQHLSIGSPPGAQYPDQGRTKGVVEAPGENRPRNVAALWLIKT